MRLAPPLFAVFAALAPLPAGAATVTLTQVAPPALYHPAGRVIDVAGVTPGMTPDEAQSILAKSYGAVQVTQDNLGLADNGAVVATQTYVTRMSARKGDEEVSVWFGTPTTGNTVVEVTRQVTFADPAEAPDLDTLRRQLTAKYGSPSLDGPASGSGEINLLAWSFKGDVPVACKANACGADLTDGLTVGDLMNYRRAVERGHDLTIVGMLLSGIADPNRAASMVVTVSDTATKLRTLDTAIIQMKSALRRSKRR